MDNDICKQIPQNGEDDNAKGSFIKNIGWLAAGKAGYLILSFLVTLTVVRYLGPYDFGTINYVDAYVKFAHVLATFGIDVILLKEVAGGEQESNTVVWTACLIRIAFGTLLGIGVTLLLYFTEGKDPVITKIAFLESIYLVFFSFHSFFEYFQAQLRSKWNAIAEMVAYLGTSLFRVILIVLKADVVWFAFANSLDMMIIAAILGTIYFKEKGFHPVFDPETAKSLLSQSWYYMIAGLLAVAFTQIDRIMIGKFLGRNDLGEYSVTTNFTSVWIVVSSILTQAFIPVLHGAFGQGRELYLRRLRQSYAAVLWLNIIFAVFVCIFARQIITVFYGETYIGATQTLKIAVWHYGLATISIITQAHLSNMNKGFYVIWLCAIGVVMDVGLNALLIPSLGIRGAAISTLVTQIVIQICLPVVFGGMRTCGIEMIRGIALWKVLNKDEWSSIRSACRSLGGKVFRKK